MKLIKSISTRKNKIVLDFSKPGKYRWHVKTIIDGKIIEMVPLQYKLIFKIHKETKKTVPQNRKIQKQNENKIKSDKNNKLTNQDNYLQNKKNWNIGANYSAKYFSYNQSGLLGKAELSMTIYNIINIYANYKIKNYGIRIDYQNYNIRYITSLKSGDINLNTINLLGNYQWFLFGIGLNDVPLFKNNNGLVSLSKISLLTFKIGLEKKWPLSDKKLTIFSTKIILDYSKSSKTDNLDIKVEKTSSFKGSINTQLSRKILTYNNYQIFASWPINLNYQSYSTTLSWGTSSGNTKSTILSISSGVGFNIHF